jgi:two-component system sensor histidine kinase KdpD
LFAIPEDHPSTAAVGVLYVLAVIISARFGGTASGVVAAVESFLCLNFFFTSPLHTFSVASTEDLAALFVFLATALVVGFLLSSVVDAKTKTERRELEARLVNELATGLLSGEQIEDVLQTFAGGICDVFGFSRCEITTSFTTPVEVTHGGPADTARVVPIKARKQLGEITVWSEARRRLNHDEQTVLESLATQLALALDGVRLSVEVRRVELEAQASQLKAALFSGVTHDVKTPLAAIMASVTSLIDGRDFSDGDRRAHLDTIKQEAERLHRVVNNLLDLARLRAGALEPVKTPSAIDELMESVVGRLRQLLDGRPIEMRLGDDLPEVPMDVVQIDQVLTNLLENAVKFAPPGTPIVLSAVGNDEGIRVTISDRGPGIRKEDRVRIFEPFERGDASTTGTGLGLAISKAAVLAHGGKMWVSDNPTGGAAFTFELPCSPPRSTGEVTHARASARS